MSFEAPISSFPSIFNGTSVVEASDSAQSFSFSFPSRDWGGFRFCLWLKFLIVMWCAEIFDICWYQKYLPLTYQI